jgi:hypothetical protein
MATTRIEIVKGKPTYSGAGIMRFEAAQDPLKLDETASYRLYRQQEEIPEDEGTSWQLTR